MAQNYAYMTGNEFRDLIEARLADSSNVFWKAAEISRYQVEVIW